MTCATEGGKLSNACFGSNLALDKSCSHPVSFNELATDEQRLSSRAAHLASHGQMRGGRLKVPVHSSGQESEVQLAKHGDDRDSSEVMELAAGVLSNRYEAG